MDTAQTVRIGAWQVSYTCHGNGPALILLHGASPGASGANNFSGNVEALAHHFKTYVVDFPSWGDSSKNLLPVGIWGNPLEAGGRVITGFMKELGIAKAHLMGSSFGASSALYAAMSAPETIDRLVLMAPGGGIPATLVPVPALSKLLGYYAGDGPTEAKFADFARHLVYDKAFITPNWLRARYEASLDPEVVGNPPLRLPPGFVPEPSQALCNDERLRRVAAPTFFIWGADDEIQPVACLPSFGAVPNQDSIVLGRCGHMPYWEHASKVNELAIWFLSRN